MPKMTRKQYRMEKERLQKKYGAQTGSPYKNDEMLQAIPATYEEYEENYEDKTPLVEQLKDSWNSLFEEDDSSTIPHEGGSEMYTKALKELQEKKKGKKNEEEGESGRADLLRRAKMPGY